MRTFPTQAGFFLADLMPHNAVDPAERPRKRGIFIKPLNDPILGPGFMRMTTALPEENVRVVQDL